MVERIFSLDIGTRSVTGIILEKNKDNQYSLIDYYTEEHQVRSMQDGQIHHVIEVAGVINNVKKKLEHTHGSLQKVCIAAAGRSLKTAESAATMTLNDQVIKDEEVVKHLELKAVQQAQANLESNSKSDVEADFYCVGYSVLHYELDGVKIGSLIDQRGHMAEIKIIATFLPKMVIESLLAALERADLKMEALTLEPIAAIDVLIPVSMRKLNVALVDIGAGTSDIALTNQGTVVAYGMVPVAGDEITEAISEHYLLDFPVAEQTKKNIVNHQKDTVTDILGFETDITYDTLLPNIIDAVEMLAGTITEEIIRLNSKSPQAVMLVGGGSLTPELASVLAEKLNLPANRVAIRDITAIQQLEQDENLPSRPDLVTPIGIAIAAKQNPIYYINIKINGKTIRMFQLKQLTVGDALLRAGIGLTKFYGKPGAAYFIKANKKDITLPGSMGESPVIRLNQKEATIESYIMNGDEITIQKGSDGLSPKITVKELFDDLPTLLFYVNEEAAQLKPSVYVNSVRQNENYQVKDNDVIEINQLKTVKEYLNNYQPDSLPLMEKFPVYVDQQPVYLDIGETQILLNDKRVSDDTLLKDNDRLTIKEGRQPKVQDLLEQLDEVHWHIIHVYFNGKPITLQQPRLKVLRDRTQLTEDSTIYQNDELIIEYINTSFIFQDIFRYVNLDLNHISGNFKLLKNKQFSGFDVPIDDGDTLEIKWD